MAISTRELKQELTQRVPPVGKVSFEEYIEWLDEDTWAEWINGEIVLMPSPASIGHQDMGSFLETILRIFTEKHKLGKIVRAPFVMKLAAIARGREPDIIFIRQDRLRLLTRTYLDGQADLAIEIVSPESMVRDRKDKFHEYEVAGIAEYWLLDPDRRTAEFYQLGDDGLYRQVLADGDGIYRSKAIPGFWLREIWLWQQPLPEVLDVLVELKVL